MCYLLLSTLQHCISENFCRETTVQRTLDGQLYSTVSLKRCNLLKVNIILLKQEEQYIYYIQTTHSQVLVYVTLKR